MCYKIALMSGKGGSGKTSLALSIADLLSLSDIKTLLIDCDLSTNGATYFFEDRLESNNSFLSLEKILQGNKDNKRPIQIKENFFFVPSVISLNFKRNSQENLPLYNIDNIDSFFHEYDVVIFDCQAGYSSILDSILPKANGTLFVMEADAVSSSAIRSLYLKIGDLLNNRTSFQVFNKVTREEYDIYNKISGGTIFSNIETILFDWKIRKAFSLLEIPSMNNVSFFYIEQLLNVCKVLFRDSNCQEKLKKFSGTFFYKKMQAEKREIQWRINTLKSDKKRRTTRILGFLALIYMVVAAFVTISMFVLKNPFGQPMIFENVYTIVSILIAMTSCVVALFVLKYPRTRFSLQRRIYDQEKELNKIEELESTINMSSNYNDFMR